MKHLTREIQLQRKPRTGDNKVPDMRYSTI